jgi:hypothetical protein
MWVMVPESLLERVMTIRCACLFAFLLASVFRSYAQQQERQTVDIVSGSLHLKAFQWKPKGPGPFAAVLFNHGSGGADAAHTAGMPITEAAEKLAPIFVKHRYVFRFPSVGQPGTIHAGCLAAG